MFPIVLCMYGTLTLRETAAFACLMYPSILAGCYYQCPTNVLSLLSSAEISCSQTRKENSNGVVLCLAGCCNTIHLEIAVVGGARYWRPSRLLG